MLAAVALPLAVMSSLIRPTTTSHLAPSPNSLSRNFAILQIEHSGQPLGEADSLQSDIEDELSVTSPPASVSFDVLPLPGPSLTPN